MATLVKGRVKFPAGRVFNTQYGERINIVVELPDKQEIKLWGKPGDIIGTYSRGEEIALMENGGKYKPLEVAPEGETVPPPPKTTPPNTMPSHDTVSYYCHLLTTCYQEMAGQMEGLPPELIKDMAVSVFIALTRKI